MRNLSNPELQILTGGYIGNTPNTNVPRTNVVEPLLPAGVIKQPVNDVSVRSLKSSNVVEPLFPAGINPYTYCENCD